MDLISHVPSKGESLRGVSCLMGGGVIIGGISLIDFFIGTEYISS